MSDKYEQEKKKYKEMFEEIKSACEKNGYRIICHRFGLNAFAIAAMKDGYTPEEMEFRFTEV